MSEESLYRAVREKHPLIHAITNPVTINDVVNVILAFGGTAICADNPKEAAEITAIADGLLLNIGMPDDSKKEAMILAGKEANKKGIPVVLDPVGAGASHYRKDFLTDLLSRVHVSCIRANRSEAAALMGLSFASMGVEDAGVSVSPESLQALAGSLDTILAVTGDEDLVVTKDSVLSSRTGSPLQKRITGSGCMLSGYLACTIASAGASPQVIHDAVSAYGLAAQRAEEEMKKSGHVGTATFRTYLIDEISGDAV